MNTQAGTRTSVEQNINLFKFLCSGRNRIHVRKLKTNGPNSFKSPMFKYSRISNLNCMLRYFSLLYNFPITTSAIYLKHLREHVILRASNLTGENSYVFNDMSNMTMLFTVVRCKWNLVTH